MRTNIKYTSQNEQRIESMLTTKTIQNQTEIKDKLESNELETLGYQQITK